MSSGDCTYVENLVKELLLVNAQRCLEQAENLAEEQYRAWSLRVTQRLAMLAKDAHKEVHEEDSDASAGNP